MKHFMASLIVLSLPVVFLAGCEAFLVRSKEAASEVDPVTGKTRTEQIIAAIPKAVTVDPTAIGTIVYNAAYILAAGLGLLTAGVGATALQVKRYKDLRAEGVTDVSLNGPVTTLTVPASAAPAALAAAATK